MNNMASERDSALTTEQWRQLEASKQYQFATILNPRRNISIRKTPQEIRREIYAWLLAIGIMGLLIYATREVILAIGS